MADKIVFISGHWPPNTYFALKTRESFMKYTEKHGYKFFYNEKVPEDKRNHALHFLRSSIIRDAYNQFPDAKWFVWVDSDVYVNNYDMKVEDQLDLSNEDILYHVCHEQNWGSYAINTGVKFVNVKALPLEDEVWSLRNTEPWNQFPFEQKTIYEHIFPKIPGKYIIHDPYKLNCIIKAYPWAVKDALFVHMCNSSVEERNTIIRKVDIDVDNSILDKIIDDTKTDKNTVHSYLPLYQKLFIGKKTTAKKVLEVGINNGGSIKLWSDFFTNAVVYGLDSMNITDVWGEIKDKENIKLLTSVDAYNEEYFNSTFSNVDIKFDVLLDDGLRTLENMRQFIKLYSQIMSDDGILIVEDVQSWDWIDILNQEVPDHLKKYIKTYDLRQTKNRYDDIVFTIDKSNPDKDA